MKKSSHGTAMGGSSGVMSRSAGGLEIERADRVGVRPPAQGLQAPPVRLATSAGSDFDVEVVPAAPFHPSPDRRAPPGAGPPTPCRADAVQRPI